MVKRFQFFFIVNLCEIFTRRKHCTGVFGLITFVSLLCGCDSSPVTIQPVQEVRVVYPNDKEILKVDSTITITAFSDSTKEFSLHLMISLDAGKKWSDLFGMGFKPRHGRIDVGYTIPDSLDVEGVVTSMRSTTCLLKAQNYEPNTIFDVSDGFFTIQ
jgi:hypothetical protein